MHEAVTFAVLSPATTVVGSPARQLPSTGTRPGKAWLSSAFQNVAHSVSHESTAGSPTPGPTP
ncbi:hypothetical protein ACFQV2_10185 [Actinokineospora soli]|uniref:Uncharacterized protein n=1 Tax=Actinokineospora soli TaxID=1048753 RepID=A0ABW2TKV1_9PSEU